jgi:hypothetical protein
MNYTVLILTHFDKESNKVLLPHLEWINKTNPDADVKIIVGEDSPMGKRYNWKNGDQPLRKWWKENGHTVKTENVAVIEWDTLVTCPLPDIPEGFDLVGKQMFVENIQIRNKWTPLPMAHPNWSNDNWYWWPDIPKLELTEEETAVGLISFGAFFMRRFVLDFISKSRWDHIYEKSIQNELRFPTIASIEGASVGEIDLPFVDWKETNLTNSAGIYHSIKNIDNIKIISKYSHDSIH